MNALLEDQENEVTPFAKISHKLIGTPRIQRVFGQDRSLSESSPKGYTHRIHRNLRWRECRQAEIPTHLQIEMLSCITTRARATVLSWLYEVNDYQKLSNETIHRATALLDRFLIIRPDLPKSKLQLAGVVALLVASKIEDQYVPFVSDLVFMTNGITTEKDIANFEIEFLQTLSFKVNSPIAAEFLCKYLTTSEAGLHLKHTAAYLLDLTLLDHLSLHFTPSLLAAGVLKFATTTLNRTQETQPQISTINHTEELINRAALYVKNLLKKIKSSDNLGIYSPIISKYSEPRYGRVAKML